MRVIGAGVGRTGTYSLKLAINRLGFGPCHHMEEVLHNRPTQLPLWVSALEGRADWNAVYEGYPSAVDWPTAAFFRELNEAFPDAKFILSERSPESWADSFSHTIYKLLAGRSEAPDDLKPWLEMAAGVIARSGFPDGLDTSRLREGFIAHNEAVKATIPEDRLLVYRVTEGWGPLCDFLGAEVPDEPFPRTNDRAEFWELVAAGQ
jgi:hypothetical protein